jgi:cadmium resistance protein CadD (predicted permease)
MTNEKTKLITVPSMIVIAAGALNFGFYLATDNALSVVNAMVAAFCFGGALFAEIRRRIHD